MSRRLQPFILGLTQKPDTVVVNKDDNELRWTYEGPTRKVQKVIRNVMAFDNMMRMMMDHPLVRKHVRKNLSLEGEAELQDMLLNQTQVDIVKE